MIELDRLLKEIEDADVAYQTLLKERVSINLRCDAARKRCELAKVAFDNFTADCVAGAKEKATERVTSGG